MIGYIKGKILSLSPDSALIVTESGLGFEMFISGTEFSALSGKTEGEAYTYMQLREDGATLFGFSSAEEKEMFLKLVSVSGVGPKLGIAVLSSLNVNDVSAAVASGDIKRLSTVKGMGKKTAERIILELKDKVGLVASAPSVGAAPVIISSGDEDAVAALMSLGFNRSESERAISRAKQKGAKEIEDIIRVALQGM